MKFFTDNCFGNKMQWPWLLINIKKYLKLRNKKKWQEIIIDPGVLELIKSKYYSWEETINIPTFLDSLPNNHYFSWDYPGDMNPIYTEYFKNRSWNNTLIYHKHPQYICTVQFSHRNYWDFRVNFDIYNSLQIESGILGLGNMCRHLTCNNFLKHALDYAFSHCKHPRIHIYGLCKDAIPYAFKLAKRFNIELSIDQEKWQFYKPSSLRPEIFKQYLNDLEKEGVVFEY